MTEKMNVVDALNAAFEAEGLPPPIQTFKEFYEETQRLLWGGRFSMQSFSQIELDSESECLIDGIIPNGGLVVFWGPPKGGKSFIVFDMSMHIALGRQYRGRDVERGSVVYLALEGDAGFKKRVAAFKKHHGVTEADFFLITERVDLIRDHKELVNAIGAQSCKPALVVIDTLNRSLVGSENSDQDMSAYIQATDAIRQAFDCAAAIIHHCGIEGTRPRGHTSLTGAVDAQHSIRKDSAGNIVMKIEWMKDGPEGDVIASRLEVVQVNVDKKGKPITTCVVLETEAKPEAVRWSKSLKVFREALAEAMHNHGYDHQIPNGPTVKAVRVDKARAEYERRYILDGTSGKAAASKAWRRALKSAHDNVLIAGETKDDVSTIWLVNE